jgi:hypothetical protein
MASRLGIYETIKVLGPHNINFFHQMSMLTTPLNNVAHTLGRTGGLCAPGNFIGLTVTPIIDVFQVVNGHKTIKEAATQNCVSLAIGAGAIAFAPAGTIGISLLLLSNLSYFGVGYALRNRD